MSGHGQHPDSAPAAHDDSKARQIGLVVALVLGVLTIVEYLIAITVSTNLPPLIVIAVVKAGLILYYFMHLIRAWTTSGEEA